MVTGYGEADLMRATEAAIRAPSLHNSQPWQFRLHDGAIDVLLDPHRRLKIADHNNWAARLAGGAALYNARLALTCHGLPPHTRLHPDPTNPNLIAHLTPDTPRPPTYTEQNLNTAIPRRHSNRGPFATEPVPPEIRMRLLEAAHSEGAWLDLLVGMTALAAFAQIANSADRVLRRDTAYQAEMASWTHTDQAPDGIPATAAGPLPEPQDLLPQRHFTDRRRAPGRDYEPEPLVGILGVPGNQPLHQITAGQAMQKVLLTAVTSGLATSLLSQPIEVPAAREQLRRSLGRSGHPQIAIRFGYGTPGRPTPRRDPAEFLPMAQSRRRETS
jgi:hypothetical protein